MSDSPSPLKIASLLPSATEMVCFLNCGQNLVARSHECDFPSFVKKIPICTSTRIHSNLSSAQINLEVHHQLKNGLSLYDIDWDQLKVLRPDLILTQSHCRACASHFDDIARDAKNILGESIRIIDLGAKKLSDVWSNIEQLAVILHQTPIAQAKLKHLSGQIDRILQKVVDIKDRPSVVAIEWIDPLMVAGNWVPELVTLAGGKNLFGVAGENSDWLTWETLQKSNPDIIVVLACGFDIDRARAEMGPLTTREGWYDLNAVQNNRVFLLDGNQFFNRPGPRLLESLEILAEIIHPDSFDFGHKLENWQYWGFDRVE